MATGQTESLKPIDCNRFHPFFKWSGTQPQPEPAKTRRKPKAVKSVEIVNISRLPTHVIESFRDKIARMGTWIFLLLRADERVGDQKSHTDGRFGG